MKKKTKAFFSFTFHYLLLYIFYLYQSKYDLTQELCQRCLAYNKSSAQAWEILGLVYEKSSDYERAAECYEKVSSFCLFLYSMCITVSLWRFILISTCPSHSQAWKLESQNSAPMGFKLAFSYLKSKKFVEAIDTCEAVLAQYPDYPRIREEILKKAQSLIRAKLNQ